MLVVEAGRGGVRKQLQPVPSMAPISDTSVYATLLMNDEYLPGAMVMGWSLRDKGAAKRKLVVLVTVDSVSANTIAELQVLQLKFMP